MKTKNIKSLGPYQIVVGMLPDAEFTRKSVTNVTPTVFESKLEWNGYKFEAKSKTHKSTK